MNKNANSEGGVKTMRTNRLWSCLVMLGIVLLAVGPGWAKISEPDNIIYGPLPVNGQPVTSGEISVKINGAADPIARFTVGSNTGAANAYILRIPMDSGEQQAPGTARPGDVAAIYLNGQVAATVTLGARGTVMKIPLDACVTRNDYYPDADNDGYPGGPPVSSCINPAGHKTQAELVSAALDCDDHNAAVHSAGPFYRDADGDGFGNPLSLLLACIQPAGYVSNSSDCNDNNPQEQPGKLWYKDKDGDGFSDLNTKISCVRPLTYKMTSELASMAQDCNDADASVHPGAIELCDHKDNNCDGTMDNGCVAGDFGKMCRNSHYLKSKNWLVRSYSTTERGTGRFSVFLEVIEPGGVMPSAAAAGLDSNPLLLSSEAVDADITLVFDESESAAYVLYLSAAGQELRKVYVNP